MLGTNMSFPANKLSVSAPKEQNQTKLNWISNPLMKVVLNSVDSVLGMKILNKILLSLPVPALGQWSIYTLTV